MEGAFIANLAGKSWMKERRTWETWSSGGVQSKDEFKLLLCHFFPPLRSFGSVNKLKTELLIEVTSRMKSLEGFEIDLSIVFFLAEGDGFLHQSMAKTPTPNLR
jgi:hypothetical protein